MNLEKQVTSVGLSNKLKKLGVRFPSLFYRKRTDARENEIEIEMRKEPKYYLDGVNCYTVAELGQMLPKGAEFHKTITTSNYVGNPNLDTSNYCISFFGKYMCEKTEANARAKCLCHLLGKNCYKIRLNK